MTVKKKESGPIMNYIYFHDISGAIAETYGYVKIAKDEYWAVRIKLSLEDFKRGLCSKVNARKFCKEKFERAIEIMNISKGRAKDNLIAKGQLFMWDFEDLKKLKDRATDNCDAVEHIKFLNKTLRYPINFKQHAYNVLRRY